VPYLDIPMQHIATPMLRAMRRAGSGDQVRKILDRLKTDVPGITLRTTLLMGFPGETDADAAEAVGLRARVRDRAPRERSPIRPTGHAGLRA
jgi:ribosomal protein S12 methylthiotransferase